MREEGLACLYCGEPLPPRNTPEHVVPASLGGRLKSTRLSCPPCNNRLGNEVDGPLAQAFALLRNFLNLPAADGAPPPSVGHVSAAEPHLELRPGGRPHQSRPDVRVEGEPGRRQIRVLAGDDHQVLQILMHNLYKMGVKPGEDLRKRWRGRLWTQRSFVQEPVMLSVGVGDPAHNRAITKMVLELFALRFPHEARGSELEALRSFVGKDTALDCVWRAASDQHPPPPAQTNLGPIPHIVSAWSTGSNTGLGGSVTLFGEFHFSVELATSWSGPPFNMIHVVNPLTGRIVGPRYAVTSPPGRNDVDAWLERRPLDIHAAKAGFGRLVALVDKVQRSAVMEDIAAAVVQETLQPNGKLEVHRITPEVTSAMARRTSELLAAVMRRQTVTTPLDIDGVGDRVAAEYPRFYDQQEARRRRRGG